MLDNHNVVSESHCKVLFLDISLVDSPDPAGAPLIVELRLGDGYHFPIKGAGNENCVSLLAEVVAITPPDVYNAATFCCF